MVAWGHLIVIHLTNVNLACQEKMTKFPFIRKGECANGHLDLMHTNVCGPMSIHARGVFIYFITFIDDSFMVWVLVSYEIQI